jgi:hypothetical protein
MSEISKEELTAFTEAHTKLAVTLERVTDALESITQKQDKLLDKMTNGVSDSIIEGVVGNYNNTHKETIFTLDRIEKELVDFCSKVPALIDEKLVNSSISKDIEHTKWLTGAVGLVVIIAMVILRIIGTNLNANIVSDNTGALQHMLQEHVDQTVVSK